MYIFKAEKMAHDFLSQPEEQRFGDSIHHYKNQRAGLEEEGKKT